MRGSVREKYGLILPNDGEALFFARRAEALGFGRIGVGEHLFFHGPTSNAFISLAAAAAATSSVRLLSAVTSCQQ